MRGLLHRDKSDLLDYFLPIGSDGEIDKILNHSDWVAISIEKGRPSIGIAFCQDTFFRRGGSVDWHYLDPAGFGISQADVAHSIWILADFLRNLLVTCELLRILRVVPLLHRQFFKLRVSARCGIQRINGNLSTAAANGTPI